MTRKPIFPDFLKIAVMPYKKLPPFALQTDQNNTLHVYDAQVISLLSEILGFKYQMIPSVDAQFGSSLPDGNWTGLVGMVKREDVDIAIGQLGITQERMTAVDFSFPYKYSPVTFITDKPQYIRNSGAIVELFDFPTWLALATSMILVSLASFFFRSRKEIFPLSLVNLFGILLGQSFKFKLQRLGITLLVISWVMGAMFLTLSYKALLLSFLTFPAAVGIRDISELAEASVKSSFKCSTYPGSFIYPTLSKAIDRPAQEIAKCMDRSQMYTHNIEDFLNNPGYKKAFLQAKSDLNLLRKAYFVSEDAFFPIMPGIAIRKNFCCKEVFTELIDRMTAVGFIQKIYKEEEFFKELEKIHLAKESKPDPKLSLENVYGAFIILISGYVISTAILAVEVILGRKFRKSRKRKNFSKNLKKT